MQRAGYANCAALSPDRSLTRCSPTMFLAISDCRFLGRFTLTFLRRNRPNPSYFVYKNKKMFRTVVLMATAAWLGAACLFVAAGVQEVTSPLIDSATKDVLVSRRFPMFYLFGFVLLGTSSLAAVGRALAEKSWFAWLPVVVLAFASGLMAYDYVQIYQPLIELITPPGNERTETFTALHRLSTLINMAGLVLTAIGCCTSLSDKQKPAVH